MYRIKNFNSWSIDKESPFGSGASEKLWLVSYDGAQKGIFKYPKTFSTNKITGEYWAEKLASEIAKVISLATANVDLGIYNSRRGSMSYMVLDKDEILIEGIHYIIKIYPNYDQDRFIDLRSNDIYSIEMIKSALEDQGDLFIDFLKIPIFDAIIGNSDRHHSNWGIIENKNTGIRKLCPVYDNGSSLCCYVEEEKVNEFLRDKLRLNSLMDTKSKSRIGCSGIPKPRHSEMVKYIKANYYNETIEFIRNISNSLNDSMIFDILEGFDNDVISNSIKELLLKFISIKRNMILEIYEIGGGMGYGKI